MASSEAAYQELDWDLGIIVDQSKDFIQQETNVAADRYQDAKILFLVLTIVVLVLSVSMALYLSRTIQRSVQYLMGISQEVADGNLTVPVEVQTQDEFGELTAAYKETIDKLHVLIDEIQRTSGEVSDFAAQLTENADQSAQATQQVATSVTNVAQSASAQGESIGTSQQEVVKMADELHGFEQKAESSSKAAERVDEIAQNGRKAMTGAISLTKLLIECTEALIQIFSLLKDIKKNELQIIDDAHKIERLESEGDRVYRHEMAYLFDKCKDPIELIKWKDILENLEETLDHCEKLSDMIRGVVMKYA